MSSTGKTRSSRVRSRAVHVYRVGVFALLLWLIHGQHSWFVAQQAGALKQPVDVEDVRAFYPQAARLSDWDPAHGGQNVFDATRRSLGYVIQTSPEADHICGFSGPTNTLIAFGADNRIRGVTVLRSDDTERHLAEVLKDDVWLSQWNGLSPDEAAGTSGIDGVSGATLTSLAIADGIATRLGGGGRTSRFPDEIRVAEVRPFLKQAKSLEPVENRPFLYSVRDAAGSPIGFAARTSPHADQMLGYQGPTDVLLVLDLEERLTGAAVRSSYDNEPFVSYLTEDEYFFNTFKGFELAEIAQIDMVDAGIDGVSGATKTSVTVAEGMILTAAEVAKIREPIPPKSWIDLKARDVGTMFVVGLALIIAFTRLRGNGRLRFAFQIVLVGYLGFINADMVSQALLVGWAQNGIAWRVAPGLVVLTAAALAAPIFTGRQVYCTHICPYGAVQDWTARRLPRQIAVRGRLERVLRCLPVLLLGWGVMVAMGHLPFSLVGIEPFDAFVFRIAGWATITVAIVGLVASLFVNRAYCRYGCPTGAMLQFLRFSETARERLGRRDVVVAALTLVALAMRFHSA